jgi:O-acetylserine/cysteine efflux transporter
VPLRAVLLACLTAIIWGVNFVVIDEGIGSIPPLTFAALRFAVVAVPAVFLVKRPAARMADIVQVGLYMSVGQFALLYTALHLGMPSGLASLVLQAQVLFTVVIAMLRLAERPRRHQLVGIGVGTVGLVVVAAGRTSNTPVLALVLTFCAALSWSMGNVAARKIGPVSGLSMTVWSATIVPVPLLALSLVLDGPHQVGHALAHLPASALWSTAYTAYLSSLVGYGIWNTLMARYPASVVAPFSLLVPPVGIAAAWIVQGERPGPAEVGGGLLLLAGVAITTITRRRRSVAGAGRNRSSEAGAGRNRSSAAVREPSDDERLGRVCPPSPLGRR